MNTLFNIENSVKRKMLRGETSVGCFLLSGNSFVAEAMANYPIDWLLTDMEASHASKEDLLHIFQAINAYDVMPFVRVADQNKHYIESCLDFGARGIMIPKIDTSEQAAQMTRSCFYPPMGSRGVNCIRASGYYTNAGDYFKKANEAVLTLVQIESQEGVENVSSIAQVSTVDVLFMGPGDLAASYGQNGVVMGELMAKARRKILEACWMNDKIAGIFAHSVEAANLYIEEGFKFIALGNDIKFLSAGMSAYLSGITKPEGA